MVDPIDIFIGYDKREAAAYYACQQSIIETCSNRDRLVFHPVTGDLRDGSNAFTYGRFLVPYRCGFRGGAIFLDGDMICRADITELWNMRKMGYGVHVVKHPDYKTKHPIKYLGYHNPNYPRKNWSSVILWDCGFFPHRILTPRFVGEQKGEYLHRFKWLDDSRIGELPPEWNRLVGEQPVAAEDKLLHYTIGTPCFAEYADCDAAEEWHATKARMLAPLEG